MKPKTYKAMNIKDNKLSATSNAVDININEVQLASKLAGTANVIYASNGILQLAADDDYIVVNSNFELTFSTTYPAQQSIAWNAVQTFNKTVTLNYTPTNPSDAATKSYVDANSGGIAQWNVNNSYTINELIVSPYSGNIIKCRATNSTPGIGPIPTEWISEGNQINVIDFGAKCDYYHSNPGTNYTDNWSIVMACLNAYTEHDPSLVTSFSTYPVYFPLIDNNSYYCFYFSRPLQVCKATHIYGPVQAAYTSYQPTLIFPYGISGIVINKADTAYGGTTPFSGGKTLYGDASGTKITGLNILSTTTKYTIGQTYNYTPSPYSHGIMLRANAIIENCQISSFDTSGIGVIANNVLANSGPAFINDMLTLNTSSNSVIMTPLAQSACWSDMAYNGTNTFVAIAQAITGVLISVNNGVTWTFSNNMPIPEFWQSITFGAGLFLAVTGGYNGVSNIYATSPDGITWTQRSFIVSGNPIRLNWSQVRFINGKFILVSICTNIILTSSDGTTWSEITLINNSIPIYDYWSFLAGSATVGTVIIPTGEFSTGGLGIGLCEQLIYLSPDLSSQSLINLPGPNYFNDIAYGNGIFCIITYQAATAATTGSETLTSPDGKTWTTNPLSLPAGSWQNIEFINGEFVITGEGLGSSGSVYTSTNGITWTLAAGGSKSSWCVMSSNSTSAFILANSGYSVNGLADDFRIDECFIIDCGAMYQGAYTLNNLHPMAWGHGIWTTGCDANAGNIVNTQVQQCGGWGFFDNSFLGNTYTGCHGANNVYGDFNAQGAVAANVFTGCYTEGSSTGHNLFAGNALILGGILGMQESYCSISGIGNGITFGGTINNKTPLMLESPTGTTPQYLTNTLGSGSSGYTNNALSIFHSQASSPLFALEYDFTYANKDPVNTGYYLPISAGLSFTSSIAGAAVVEFANIGLPGTFTAGRGTNPPSATIIPNLFLGIAGNNSQRQFTTATSIPNTGWWGIGDVVMNANPNVYPDIGWVCTTAAIGTAGAKNPITPAVFASLGNRNQLQYEVNYSVSESSNYVWNIGDERIMCIFNYGIKGNVELKFHINPYCEFTMSISSGANCPNLIIENLSPITSSIITNPTLLLSILQPKLYYDQTAGSATLMYLTFTPSQILTIVNTVVDNALVMSTRGLNIFPTNFYNTSTNFFVTPAASGRTLQKITMPTSYLINSTLVDDSTIYVNSLGQLTTIKPSISEDGNLMICGSKIKLGKSLKAYEDEGGYIVIDMA